MFHDVCIYMSIRVYIRIYILGNGETICELCCSVLPARQAHQGSKSLRCPLLLQFLKIQLYSHLTQYTQYRADYLRIFAHQGCIFACSLCLLYDFLKKVSVLQCVLQCALQCVMQCALQCVFSSSRSHKEWFQGIMFPKRTAERRKGKTKAR